MIVTPSLLPDCPRAMQIQAWIDPSGDGVVRLDEQSFLTRLDSSEMPAPLVVVFAPSLVRPVALARLVRQRCPSCELLFVRDGESTAEFRRSLGVAPLLGSHWSIAEFDSLTLGARVARAVAEAKRRSRFRTTLDRVNQNMTRQAESLPVRRAQLADYYLASFFSSAQEALVGIDQQGQVLFWSAGARELFGLEEKTVFGREAATLPFWNSELAAVFEALVGGGEACQLEVACDCPGGPLILDILASGVGNGDGEPMGMSLVIRDITSRATQRAANEALMQAERKHLYQLFEQAPGFVAVTRGADHLMELANRAFYQLVGHRDVLGRPFVQAFLQQEGKAISRLLDRVFATRRPFVGRGMPLHVQRAREEQAQLRYVDFVFQPVLSEQGQITGIFCQGHDVTLQMRAQQQLQRSEETLQALVEERTRELERSQQALLHSQKLEAIGKLTGGVAHDFNNVLQIIGANLQLLREPLATNAAMSGRLDAATAAVERGSKLSSQLLAFARRQPLNPLPVNPARLLRAMDDLLRRALGEDIQIETVVAGGLWNTLVDPNQLEHVVLNLAINARDAMPLGGRLTLELGNARLDDLYTSNLPDVQPGQYVMLAISDTGCGMSRETAERAFEPFFTTKPEGQGTGLGLSMAYGFIKQSGGHIRIYSEPGNGTTIKLYLPRTVQEEAERVSYLAGPVVGGSETILVVEDDPAVQVTVIDQLSGLGYSVLRASDAQSALSILQSGLNVDLLFTDVVMPGPLRAPELARQAVRLLPELVVLFTSGYTQDAIVHGGKLDPGVELISKPYRMEDLARKIRHLLANREAMRASLPQPNEPAMASGRQILVVEDQPVLLELTCEMLQMLGHAPTGVGSAEQALERLALQPFDMLVTDVGLPGLSGLELLERVRASWPVMEVVVISGYGDALGDVQARILSKPFTFDQLEACLKGD